MNVLIETDEEVILLHTNSMDRAKEVLQNGNVSYSDMYEIADEDIQYHSFDSRIIDPKLTSD